MKRMKKLIAVLLMAALMVPTAVFAATPSAQKISVSDASVSQTSTEYGKLAFSVTVAGKALAAGSDYQISLPGQDVGTYTGTITGINNYTGTKTFSYTVTKVEPTKADVEPTVSKKVVEATKPVTKVKITVTNPVPSKAVKYEIKNDKKAGKAVKVTKKGVVKVKKGAKKGVYKIKVTTPGDKNHKKTTKIVKIKVK